MYVGNFKYVVKKKFNFNYFFLLMEKKWFNSCFWGSIKGGLYEVLLYFYFGVLEYMFFYIGNLLGIRSF